MNAATLSSDATRARGAAPRLAELLVRAGLVDAAGARQALARLAAQGGWLGEHLVALGLVEPGRLADALAQVTRIPRVALARLRPEPGAAERLDRAFCAENRCLPLAVRDGGATLVLAVVDPTDAVLLQKVGALTGCAVRPAVVSEPELGAGLAASASAPRPDRGISFDDANPGEELVTSLAGSMVEPTAQNEPVGLTPPRLRAAPGAGLELEGSAEPDAAPDPLAELTRRLAATEAELRRTQQMVRALVGIALQKGLASREELAALAARPPSR